MLACKTAEYTEDATPDEDEEDDDDDPDGPDGCVGGREEVPPVAAVGRREPVVLQDDHDEEPEDDFAMEERAVEGGHLTGLLAVVGWETKEE